MINFTGEVIESPQKITNRMLVSIVYKSDDINPKLFYVIRIETIGEKLVMHGHFSNDLVEHPEFLINSVYTMDHLHFSGGDILELRYATEEQKVNFNTELIKASEELKTVRFPGRFVANNKKVDEFIKKLYVPQK